MTAPVPAALMTVWLLVLDWPLLYCADGEAIDVVELVEDLIELLACGGVAEAGGPAVAVVGLVAVVEAALVARAGAETEVIGDGGVLLRAVPVAGEAVEAAVKGVKEAVACAVVGELAGEHGAAGDPTVVGAAGVGHDLRGGVLIAQADDGVVLRVRPRCSACAAFDIAAGEGVAVALREIDADGAA